MEKIRGIFLTKPDGFWGTFKSLWIIHPEERRTIVLMAIPAFLGSMLVSFYLYILKLLGKPYRNPFYK